MGASSESILPAHWGETSLQTVVISKKGKKPRLLQANSFTNSVPYIDIEAFETGNIKQYADIETSNICELNDVLVVWDGARFGLTGFNQNGAIGSTLMCLSPIVIESKYLLNFIKSHYQTIQANPKGTGIPHVNPDVLWNLTFPLPPLNEQKRIVGKLDAMLPRVQSAKARLEKIPAILKKFRQSVLAAACSGRLTEEWREGNRINYNETESEDTKSDYNIDSNIFPSEWNKYRLETVSNYLNGFQFKSSKYVEVSNNQVIRIGNVKNGFIQLDESPVYIDDEYATISERFEIKENDILLSLTGTKYKRDYGFACIIKSVDKRLFLNQRVVALRVKEELITASYLVMYLQTPFFRDVFFSNETGNANQGNVGIDAIRYPIIGVPSIVEQKEIVRRIEKLFKLADSLDAKYQKAYDRVMKIEQAILAKAFRGELVEADPDDEPAEELLKRIMEEKGKIEGGKKRRAKSRVSKS